MPSLATAGQNTGPSSSEARSGSVWWLGLLALWLLATAWMRPLLLPDEGRYAGVAREMLAHGALVPLLDGLPFFHKPPLMYWLDMAAMAVLGVNPFSARVAPAIGGWLMGASMFLAMRRWYGGVFARQSLLVLATSPFFFIGAQYANLDMLVGGLITATVLAFVRCVDAAPAAGGSAVSLRWLLLAWSLAALSVLAKGLIGIVLPMLVVGPWLLARGRWRDVLRLLHPLGLLLFLALALPWFVAMQSRYPGFFDYFIVEQHFRRFALKSFNNARPMWFYLGVLPLLTLPWALWLVASWRAWRRPPFGRATGPGVAPTTLSLRGLWVWWVVAVVAFFSLPTSKLVGYVLPALAPWCVWLAWGTVASPRAFRMMVGASALLDVSIVAALAWQAPNSSQPAARMLAAQMAAADHVVFVDHLFYDLPFYAGLKQPVIVASHWSDPDLPRHDNWRKELFDAARFDPVRGRELLWPIDRLAELTCHDAAVWWVVKPADASLLQAVPGVGRVYHDADQQLWRAPGRHCP